MNRPLLFWRLTCTFLIGAAVGRFHAGPVPLFHPFWPVVVGGMVAMIVFWILLGVAFG